MRLRQEVRIALRGFLRAPTFTVTAVLILAVGIGMAVAMFTVFDAVLVRQLPVRDPGGVVELYTYDGDPNTDYYLLRPDLQAAAKGSRAMREIAGIAHWGAAQAPMLDGDRSLVLDRALVTGNFFPMLGVRPLLGRLIHPDDEMPGAALVVVLSYATWKNHFGGDPHVVGRKLLEPYARNAYEIIGVTPPGLDYPRGVDYWIPNWQPTDRLSVIAVARLAPGATPAAAESEFLATLRALHPDRAYDGVHVRSFTQAVVGDVRPILIALTAAVSLLLLIACVNVGNLLLVRASGRARELAVRRALGASMSDIVRQLTVEAMLLGVAGGVLGALVADTLVRLFLLNAPAQLPRVDAVGTTGVPLLIVAGITAGAVLLFGVAPAVAVGRRALAGPLRLDSRTGAETRRRRSMRQILVASQVALAVVMLAGAGLVGRSLARLQSITLGYDPEHLSLLTVSFPPSEYNDASGKFSQQRVNALADRLVSAWRAIPGVAAITPALVPPFLGANIFVGRFDLPGQSEEQTKGNPMLPVEVASADYFRVFGIPLIRGRGFTEQDDERGDPVAIVSESVARRFWPDRDPIGQRVRFWSADTTKWRTVVGVAGDIRWRSLRDATPSVYLPWKQAYWQGAFAIRTSGELASVLPALRRGAAAVNPLVTLWDAKSMDELLDKPLAQPRMSALLLGAFALVSMLLAAIGLYGVMASVVRASTRELGIRAALGASPERLRAGVLRQALSVTGIGAVVGLVAAIGSSRLLASMLFEVSPTDPVTLAGATILLVLVALVAAYVPARRATRVDPVEALRTD